MRLFRWSSVLGGQGGVADEAEGEGREGKRRRQVGSIGEDWLEDGQYE